MPDTSTLSDTAPIRTASLGIVRVQGPDAESFLHAQLTQSVTGLQPDRGAPAAWLDARGRVLACFDVVPLPSGGFDLIAPAVLVETLARRLRLYVLRAAVEVLVPNDSACFAVTGPADAWLERTGAGIDRLPYAVGRHENVTWLRIAPALAYGFGPPSAAAFASGGGNEAAVEAAEIGLGRPQVFAATTASFTAHMLNLDRLGAIAFDKGCYPGQEVVARTHNLGTPKRRMFGFSARTDSVPAPGDAIADASGNAAGTVVRAARSAERVVLLAVVRVDTADSALALAQTGTSLARMPVPGEPDA